MSFGSNMTFYRKKKRMGRKELARITRISGSMILNYEAGNNEPTISKAAAIAEALDVPIDVLWYRHSCRRSDEHELTSYHRKLIRAAIDYRIKKEVRSLAKGLMVSEESVRKAWEGQN